MLPNRTAPEPGGRGALVREVLTTFVPRFAPSARPIYVAGDERPPLCDEAAFASLDVTVTPSGAMPAVVLHDASRGWLFLMETDGPIDTRRVRDLTATLGRSTAGLVFVTVVPDRVTYAEHSLRIALHTHVWAAAEPDHMIHYDDRMLGPRTEAHTGGGYPDPSTRGV